eukprot:XP_014029563.1 PREDICTED: rho GTPase-activating protein 20-like isoform X2 [Salmo salar]
METMSPQQGTIGQNRSGSLTGNSKFCALPDSKKMKTLAHRRQSAPSLVISKALTKSRSMSRENCLSPVSPEKCPLVQAFLSPWRVFLAHAHTQLQTGLQTQERHLFLFTDTLLIAKAKSSTHFKLKAQVRMCEMWIAGCMEDVCEGTTSPERSFVMGWPTFNCVATFSSVEHKEKWLSLIKSRINEEKEKDDPKTIPLKIFAKDIGNCAYAKTLAVSNSDSTTDVIRMALQLFGISGCVKDHQLWMSSCKDDSPYPLIGHEFPFSIKMSQIRNVGAGGDGGKDAIPPPPEDQGAMLLDQCLPPDTQCQFILKPSRVGLRQAPLIEPGQKSVKRKRLLINWAFWRGSSSQLDGVPLSPTSLSPTPGRLFGRSLSSVCHPDHTLPKPVMDMLVFLYQEGPYTRGIFRRSAGAKACRELRDRLDNGTEDTHTLTHESVFVTAAVFKDFLRNVPGSLLCVDLYEQWVGVMEREEEEEKWQAIHRLVHLLPSENLLLLRHVVAVLHCIQGNAEDNQMNAFNLSVCIAPSMLWTPAPCSPRGEGEATKKVCELVRFLIENCRKVLGDDVTSLFGAFPQKSNSSDHGSDVSSFQMNDSSYDSLENELNEDPESPFQESLPLRDKAMPDSHSRDSVITLSDCDPDPDPDPEDDLLHLPPLPKPRKFTSAVRQPQPRQSFVQSHGPRRLRRSSEPALGHTPGALIVQSDKHSLASRKASYDAAMEGEEEEEEEEEDEVFLKQGLRALQLKDIVVTVGERGGVGTLGRRKLKHAPPPPLRLDASCSSLSSPATSPTGSSLSSLDSAFSQYSTDYVTSAGFHLAEPSPHSPLSPRFPLSHLFPLSPRLPRSPQGSPPKRDTVDWSQSHPPHSSRTPSTHHGLYPNTWFKRDRRLSLRQPDNGHLEEEVGEGEGVSLPKSPEVKGVEVTTKRRSSSPPSYQQAILQLQGSRSPFYRGTEKPLTVRELRLLHDQSCKVTHRPPTGSDVTQQPTGIGSENIQPPQGVFYGQSSSTLTLQRHKSHSLTPAMEASRKVFTMPRRASEPSCVTDAASSLTLERPRVKSRTHGVQDQQLPESGLRVSDVEPQRNGAGPNSEPGICLSPSATRAVRDYFSSQGRVDSDACLGRSQEVALALVQGKREWQSRKCSDPCVDDFDQMFFAEESYV